MGLDIPVRGSNPIVAVFTFDVRVVFDIREDVKASPCTGFREGFSNGIDSTTLGTSNYPSKIVLFGQLWHPFACLLNFSGLLGLRELKLVPQAFWDLGFV